MHEISSLTWDFPVCICLAIRTFRLVRFFIQCAGIPATTHSTRQKWRWDFGKTSGKCWSRSLAIWAFEVRCYNIASQAKEWKCSNTVKKRQVCLELSMLVVALENECTKEECPEMKADGWLYLCAAHPSTQSVWPSLWKAKKRQFLVRLTFSSPMVY